MPSYNFGADQVTPEIFLERPAALEAAPTNTFNTTADFNFGAMASPPIFGKSATQKLEEELLEAKTTLRSTQIEAEELQSSSRKAIKASHEAEVAKESALADLAQLKVKFEAAQKEIAAFKALGLENKVQKVTAEKQDLEEEVEGLKESKDKVVKERDLAVEARNGLEIELNGLKGQYSGLLKANNDLSTQIQDLTAKNEDLAAQNKGLTDNLEKREAENRWKDLLFALVIMLLALLALFFFSCSTWTSQPGAFGYGGPSVDNFFTRLHARIAEAAYDKAGPFEIFM
jgi:FtsZ-binding cell division protein ZapB